MNRVAGAVTSGQYLRGNGTNVLMSAIQAADVPTLNQSTTGNAATATTLQTARTIGGVSFNGSANINLPGVNTAGNQNTTGTAANVTGTVAIANGGTGSTTAAAARTALGATTLGSNLFTITNPSAITFPRFNANNTVSSLSAADFRTAIGAGTSSTTGTVTSVGGTGTVSGLSLSGTVTTSGNLTLGGTLAVLPSNFASQTAKTVLAAPNAAAGVPTFRLLVASDIPTLNQNTTGSAATLTTGRTIAITGDLTYTSGSFNGSANVTGTGTLANSGVTAGTYTKVTVDAKGRVTVGASLIASDVPTLNQNTTGTAAISTAATVTTSATASAFKVPFANTTASTTGNYGLLQDSTATFTYNPSTNTLVAGTFSGALSGNATTATTLQTARTIGGVSFNGSANINLPGVNTAGNQNTTGSAATLTTTRTLWGQNFNGGANVTGALTSVGNITGTGAVTLTATSGTLGLTATGANIITATTNAVERMRIDSSGDLLVGTTSAGVANTLSTTIETSAANNSRITVNHSSIAGSGNDSNYMQFGYGGNLIGRIVQATTTSVSYTTSSDYRLKENIQPMTGGLARVAALKPRTYTWKSTGEAAEGFIAHELAEVCPSAVCGEKDAVDKDGSIKPQGIDTSFLVATLTAAIQEQQAIITALTARVEALEGTQP
jgi:hypothetical protein